MQSGGVLLCLLIQTILKSGSLSEDWVPPVNWKGAEWPLIRVLPGRFDHICDFHQHLPFSGPSRGWGRTLLRRGSCFQNTEMKEPLKSNSSVQWPILFGTILTADLSLAFQSVASRILSLQGAMEKPWQMVRPLGRERRSWQQNQSDSASL